MSRILNRSFLVLIIFSLPAFLNAQVDYNTFVGSPVISPSPLLPVEEEGAGTFTFNTGNTGTLPMTELRVSVEISLSNGIPSTTNPLDAVSGTAAGMFTWTYRNGSFTGEQRQAIPAGYSGTIIISYRVTENSTQDNPGNGFSATVRPGQYQNTPGDDVISLYTYTQCTKPSVPVLGERTQPDCDTPTGSVMLSGLPETGNWTINGTPNNVVVIGTGTSATITGLAPATYSFTVTNAGGCTSEPLGNVVINDSPSVSSPGIGTVTQPTCLTPTGSVNLTGLPSQGTWTILITPSGTRTGSGSTYTVTELQAGTTYTFAVRSAEGCTSTASEPVTLTAAPQIPTPPVVGTTTQPTCDTSTGSVQLSGLPSTGTWTISGTPGSITRTGTGGTVLISGLSPNTYSFTVTYPAGCTSQSSASVIINSPPPVLSAPVPGTPVQPTCTTPSGSVTITGLPSAGTWTLTRTPGNVSIQGTGSSTEVTGIPSGTYYFSVSGTEGCRSQLSAAVNIDDAPSIPSEPVVRIDCFLGASFAVVTVVSPRGSGLEYRLDNGQFTDTPAFSGVRNGNHTVTVRSRSGCTTTGDEFSVSCGCVNGPTLTLSSRTGNTCGLTPVTISDNTFGGNATSVTITENGAGSLTSGTVTASPFSFTYNPAQADIGRTVVITFITNNPVGEPCSAASSTYTLTVNPLPAAPVPGTPEHPTCTSSTGRINLTGLPSQGNWTLTRNPGNVTSSGTGASVTVTGLESGTYTFSVTYQGCSSPASSQVVINPQPTVPAAPVSGSIVHPGCGTNAGSVTLTGLPATGTWTLVQYPGTVTTTGTGATTIISNLQPGTYNFTVRRENGCTSLLSANIVINQPPPTPTAPVAGSITVPTCIQPSGSVVLTGLPNGGNWTINSIPAGVSLTGRGSTTNVRGLAPGTYVFNVTNASGCISANSANVVIPQIPGAPVLVINNPPEVCAPATVNLTNPSITAGSTTSITITYWMNAAGTVPVSNPASVTAGTYYIRGTNAAQCSVIEAVSVVVLQQPSADAGPDQELDFRFTADIAGNPPAPGETGSWSVITGKGVIGDPSLPRTYVTDLETGENILVWKIENNACPASEDTLRIIVRDLVVPSLITPNEDGRNDFLVLRGIDEFPGNELYIFDRRGTMIYKSMDYKNDWNGIDHNGNTVPDGTYYYVFKSGNGRQRSGYIVIRR